MTEQELKKKLAELEAENAKLKKAASAAAVHVSEQSGAVHLALGPGRRPVAHHVETWDAIMENIEHVVAFLTPEVRSHCAKLRQLAKAARG